MSNLSLYQIEEHFLLLIEAWEDARQQQSDDLENGLDVLASSSEDRVREIEVDLDRYIQREVEKVDNIAGAIRHFQRMETLAKEESARLAARAAQAKAIADHIKERTIAVMEQMEKKVIPGQYNTLSIQGNGGVRPVNVRQPELVPDEFMLVTVRMDRETFHDFANQFVGNFSVVGDAEPDKAAIRYCLQGGDGQWTDGVPGCILEDRGKHLRVK